MEATREKPETEDDKLIRAFQEAHANLTIASSHVRTTFVQFSFVLREYMAHVDTVRKWIREKQLKAVSPGRRAALDKFMRSRERCKMIKIARKNRLHVALANQESPGVTRQILTS